MVWRRASCIGEGHGRDYHIRWHGRSQEEHIGGIAEGGSRGEARFVGVFPNTAGALTKLAGKLAKTERRLRFCYEAGPCGYVVHRQEEVAWP